MNRRTFLKCAAAAVAVPRVHAAVRAKRLLLLGGTNFTGPHIVDAARARGYEVTLFNRGQTNAELFPDLEKLRGDRDPDVGAGISALAGRRFDGVIDTSGHVPRHVRASAKLLAENVERYVFVSSLSAYASHAEVGADEDAPLATLESETEDFTGDAFGPLKALCERAAEEELPGRVAVVRPGLIVGPRDRSDRFTYWVARLDRGGEVLAPGAPGDPIMLIDGRDLADWLVRLVDERTTGVFNAIGPEQGLTMQRLLEACQQAAAGADPPAPAATFRYADAAFLAEHAVAPWTDLPVWIPPEGETAGFHRRSIARALKAGLQFRSIDETAADTLAWWREQPEARRAKLKRGLTLERERELLEALRAR